MALEKEPARLGAYAKGFLFLPTAGMRLAPEVLVLELFREGCFANMGGATNSLPEGTSARKLDPDLADQQRHLVADSSRSAVYALRGRKIERGGGTYFYAPAYPSYAGLAWLRRQSDRVVRDFFFKGPLAVAASSGAIPAELISELTAKALYGGGAPTDVFKRCESEISEPYEASTESEALVAIKSLIESGPSWGLSGKDELSLRIAKDWLSLCRLEPFVPRLAWISLVSTFMRVSLPIWLLAQMRVMEIIREAVRKAMSGTLVPVSELSSQIAARHDRLLTPADTLNDSIDDAVVRYMRARCEVNLALIEVSKSSDEWREKLTKPLSMSNDAGDTPVEHLLKRVHELAQIRPEMQRDMLRSAEKYPAWVDPLKKGQGKNIEEFLRVLRNDHVGSSDDAFLLERGPKNRRMFKVFPAPKVLAMYALLAHVSKSIAESGETRLLLSDLEQHLREVGIDFSLVGGARSKLLRSLSGAGILRGTPDAGDGVELMNPFHGAVSRLLEQMETSS